MRIQGVQAWDVNENLQVGKGGFARVFAAVGADGLLAVAKIVPKEHGSTRDQLVQDLPSSPHIVPILDVIETGDAWVLILPRAEYSLREYLDRNGRLELSEAIGVLQEIALGLEATGVSIVHRDLKPENVLFLNGKWAITDFGIARYAAASTAPDTQKYSLSPPYAAPEQWRAERATPATDVYAFGVLAFEICLGARPFPGPAIHDYRDQHLNQQPLIEGLPGRLASLLTECLLKASAARPTPSNLVARLERAGEESRMPGASALADANRAHAETLAALDSFAAAQQSESERREILFDSAKALHSIILEQLVDRITEEAPSTSISKAQGRLEVRLGDGSLTLARQTIVPAGTWGGANIGLDVIAHSSIEVTQPADQYGYRGRSHSLYFCDFAVSGEYGWFEVAYMRLLSSSGDVAPFSLPPEEAVSALGQGLGAYQLAYGFLPVRLDELDAFIDRWLLWFAASSRRALSYPSTLPEGRTFGLRNRA